MTERWKDIPGYEGRYQRHIYHVATLFMMAFGRELIK